MEIRAKIPVSNLCVLYYIILYYTILYHILLYYIKLYNMILYHIILFRVKVAFTFIVPIDGIGLANDKVII